MNVPQGPESKSVYRRKFRELRNKLSVGDEKACNRLLLEQCKQFVWTGLGWVHIFLPIRRLKEPDTLMLADWLRATYPEMRLVISRSDLNAGTMDHYIWEKDDLLEVNAWGIEEPRAGLSIMAHQLDAVLVPLLAYDKEGNRLGYGKGFYDRFLAGCRPDCLKIGLSFFEAVDSLPAEPTDIPLDFCISSRKIWKFPNKPF